MRTLYVGFKGKNNTSFQLVSRFSGEKVFLTNSFSGLAQDIDTLSTEYDSVFLFGVDKSLTDSVRIDNLALLDGLVLSSHLSVMQLSSVFRENGVRNSISNEPTRYLCNDAYFRLLKKFNHNVILIHIPSTRHMRDALISDILNSFAKFP